MESKTKTLGNSSRSLRTCCRTRETTQKEAVIRVSPPKSGLFSMFVYIGMSMGMRIRMGIGIPILAIKKAPHSNDYGESA